MALRAAPATPDHGEQGKAHACLTKQREDQLAELEIEETDLGRERGCQFHHAAGLTRDEVHHLFVHHRPVGDVFKEDEPEL